MHRKDERRDSTKTTLRAGGRPRLTRFGLGHWQLPLPLCLMSKYVRLQVLLPILLRMANRSRFRFQRLGS